MKIRFTLSFVIMLGFISCANTPKKEENRSPSSYAQVIDACGITFGRGTTRALNCATHD